MANKANTKSVDIETTENNDVVEKEEKVVKTTTRKSAPKKTVDDIRPSDRVSIDNLCDWVISFESYENGRGIDIPDGVKNYKNLTVSEVDAQVKTGNIGFVGTDGFGSHAPFKINDPVIREYVFGEPVDPVQLTEDAVKELLAIQNKQKFYDALNSLVVTKAEKRMIVRLVERVGMDDVPAYQIAAIEKISGIKFN